MSFNARVVGGTFDKSRSMTKVMVKLVFKVVEAPFEYSQNLKLFVSGSSFKGNLCEWF